MNKGQEEKERGQEDKQKEADLLSHAPNNKAFWETNTTLVEWSLRGKPQIPVKDEGKVETETSCSSAA